jgi:hypothetical protein
MSPKADYVAQFLVGLAVTTISATIVTPSAANNPNITTAAIGFAIAALCLAMAARRSK